MANLTTRFGFLLILLGAIFFVVTTPHAPTSLIPAFFGFVLAGLGFAAQTEDTKRRMLFMHIAVTVGLLGFLFPFFRSIKGALTLPRAVPSLILERLRSRC